MHRMSEPNSCATRSTLKRGETKSAAELMNELTWPNLGEERDERADEFGGLQLNELLARLLQLLLHVLRTR